MTPFHRLRRRLILSGAAGTGLGMQSILAHAQAPAAVTLDRARPQFPSGVQSGDVTADRALVWARSDRTARMWLEWSTTAGFGDVKRVRGPFATEASDHTARIDLSGLPAGQDIFYRVSWEDAAGGALSAPMSGHLRTPPGPGRDVKFVWSGDTAGQGWGISEAFGGMRIYETMRRLNPDFFLHSGDTIYADNPILPEVKLPDGTVWKNDVVTEEKSKVAETLKEFRGNYRYNMLDANVRRFNADVMQIWQWDDHEVTNNWSSSKDLSADKRYTEKNVGVLTARATRAFLENAPMRFFNQQEEERVYRQIPYGPMLDVFVIDMRSYRGPNTHNLQTQIDAESTYLGEKQLAWLQDALKRSRATWKVIASDMPIGLQVGDGKDAQGRDKWEAVANGEDGVPKGRELEIARLLSFIKRQRIRNTVWLTADVHYTAAHHYHPNRAAFQDFDPFWEFVGGPLHAGGFGPGKLDRTFGPEVRFVKSPNGVINEPPSAGGQYFGEVQIDARTAQMTVHLRNLYGASLWSTTLDALRG